jgi:O-antigen/teichoic acid export membrane protein
VACGALKPPVPDAALTPIATAAEPEAQVGVARADADGRRRRLVVNATWTSGVFLASAAAMFFLSPYVLRSLGKASYGVWEIVMSLTGYLGFADLGVRPAVVYFVARHDALGERDEVNRYVNAALLTFGACGAAILAAAALLAPHVPAWFGVDPASASDASLAVLLTSASLALTLPLNAFSAVLVGKERYRLLCSTDLVVLAAKVTATVLVLRAGGGLLGLALVTVGADLLEMTAKAAWAFRVHPGLRIAPSLASLARCRALLRYGGAALLVSLAQLVIWRTDALVVGAMLGAEAVAVFAIGSKLPSYARSLTTAASRVLTPAASRLEATGDRAGLLRMVARGSRAMLLVGGAMLAYLVACGEPFLARWQGDDFRGEAAAVLVALSIGAVGPVAAYPFEAVLYGARRVGLLGVLSVVEAVANLGLSLLLARPYGVLGVALGTAIPALAIRLVVLPWASARSLGGRFGPLALRAFAAPVLAATATALLLRAVVDPRASLGWPALLAIAAGAQVAFLAIHAAIARVGARRLDVETLPVPATR